MDHVMHLFLRHTFIRFVCAVSCFNRSAYKLAVSDGWARVGDGWTQVGDGWANAHPGPPLAMLVVFNTMSIENILLVKKVLVHRSL